MIFLKFGLAFLLILDGGNAWAQAVISDEGRVEKVLIYELRAGYRDVPSDTYGLFAKSFLSRGIKVCSVRNILCSSGDIEAATLCIKPTQIDSSLLPIGLFPIDFEKIGFLAPLNLKGPFSIVIDSSKDTIDYRALTKNERLDFLLSYYPQINGCIWDGSHNQWINEIDSLKVIPDLGWGLINGFSEVYQYSKTIKSFEIVSSTDFDSTNYHQTIHWIPWEIICPDLCSAEFCYSKLENEISDYAQDEFHIRTGNYLDARYRPYCSDIVNNRFNLHARNLCGKSSEDVLYKNPIKGGNYFLSGPFIFVGMDELVNFRTCENWSRSIGLGKESKTQEISKALEGVFNPNLKIVWIGDSLIETVDTLDCNLKPKEERHQPVYHIDLFFHPQGFVMDSLNGSDSCFAYLIAIPDFKFQDTSSWSHNQISIFRKLKYRLEKANARLIADIKVANLTPYPIEIPLLVSFKSDSTKPEFISFTNGLVSKKDDKPSYIIPGYINPTAHFGKGVKYDEALMNTIERLNKVQIETEVLYGNYEGQSALHCKVKVLKRTP